MKAAIVKGQGEVGALRLYSAVVSTSTAPYEDIVVVVVATDEEQALQVAASECERHFPIVRGRKHHASECEELVVPKTPGVVGAWARSYD